MVSKKLVPKTFHLFSAFSFSHVRLLLVACCFSCLILSTRKLVKMALPGMIVATLMAMFTLVDGAFGKRAKRFLRNKKGSGKVVLFLNAVSGTGKSSVVPKIIAYCPSQGWTFLVLSADTAPGAIIKEKHSWCQDQLSKATEDVVIIDNTNLGPDPQNYLKRTTRIPLMFALRLTESGFWTRLKNTGCFSLVFEPVSRCSVTLFSQKVPSAREFLLSEFKNPKPWNKASREWLFSGEEAEVEKRIFRIVAAFFLNHHNVPIPALAGQLFKQECQMELARTITV